MPTESIAVETQFQQAVIAHLETNLQDGAFDVIPGERDGPVVRDRNLACVFSIDSPTDAGNPAFMRPVLVVRAWIARPKIPKKQVPSDNAPLQQLKHDLAVCLQQIQTLPDVGIWGLYFFVTNIRTDKDDWGVEATLQAWTGNPAVINLG